MSRNGRGGIKALWRFGRIVDLLADRGPLGVQAVADELDIAKSTAHAYLSTMRDLGYTINGPNGYELSLKFLEYGIEERADRRILDAAEEPITRLAEDTGEAVYLVIEENGFAVYLDYALGERAVRTHARIGTRVKMHSLASGRAILAHLPESRVADIIEQHGLPAQTDQTVTTKSELLDELEDIRDRGYAVNEGEATVGTRAVAAPVVTDGTVHAAIAVVGPANRLTRADLDEYVVHDVLATANQVEILLQQ